MSGFNKRLLLQWGHLADTLYVTESRHEWFKTKRVNKVEKRVFIVQTLKKHGTSDVRGSSKDQTKQASVLVVNKVSVATSETVSLLPVLCRKEQWGDDYFILKWSCYF